MQTLKQLIAFGTAGFGGGVVVSILHAPSLEDWLALTLSYVAAGLSAGLIWIGFDRLSDLQKNRLLYAVACLASAVVAGNVLLLLGYDFDGYVPNATVADHIRTSIGFGVGGLIYGGLTRLGKPRRTQSEP